MIIFAANAPLVLNGTYDREGYTPKERRAQARKLEQEDRMKKKARAKGPYERHARASQATPNAPAKRRKWSASRINTHRSNGATSESTEAAPEPISVGEAVRRAVEQLGDVRVDPALAPTQLLELGECYENVAREQARYDAKAEEAKTAKKSLESAQQLLLERVKTFTHPSPLPLFDGPQAEADRQDMLDAAAKGGAEA